MSDMRPIEVYGNLSSGDYDIGDTIKCHDKDDMVDTMQELAKCGIKTDFLYEKDGVKGWWLVVVNVESEE